MRSLQKEDVECVTLEVTANDCRPAHLHLCPEAYIRLLFNGRLIAAETIYPKDLRAFATGLLLAEKLLVTPTDIKSLTISEDTIAVEADASAGLPSRESIADQVDLTVIYRGYLALEDCARVCQATGGTHCSLLLTAYGGIVSSAEDVNRLASLDKAIGKAALAGYSLGDCILLSTGRTTEDIVSHASAVGIKVIAACGAPSSRAVRHALDHDICLLAIPGPHQVIIYSGKERIRESEWIHPSEPQAFGFQ
ncbi:putative formate dehydrogenase accessory protein [Methanocella arvoryzae MRE50]|uniref:Formate dehydrogenase accessory protein n=2 Tax=Methanocella TaxID=570266 RepID=Q0W417_METAR|nr:putative formate dehydrogenase accessory protein [Methanocella arvoryzae MRE50]